jgi:GTP cyclohydrolase II
MDTHQNTKRKNLFTETGLETKFGDFVIRVYADAFGKETIVLRTKDFDPQEPVLVRVHSECITGDTFGSLRCDCGEQLHRSIEMIEESKNGALIYLRQEGRGIGLFEKMRSYELQRKGYDTFEANVILGHKPDERSYGWAKTALKDLGVEKIKLITNNPSKVSEVAKLGISVVERVPIIIKSNKYNKKYFDAKRDKFKHFFNKDVSYYFYQFHAETPEHVQLIGEFMRDNKRDPLLKICVGVSANHQTLSDDKALERIKLIFETCEYYEGFVPILHFSFKNSPTPQEDVKTIHKKMPYVAYLQTNDVEPNDFETIEIACKTFLADIPLFDANFSLVEDKKFRDTIMDNKAFVLLDNSKGTGVRETKENLMKKIDTLLSYGMNDIAIFGGFGPDDLDTYFELRRHYKINFSIDAETKLKTNGEIDIEKTKTYLRQLLRFDDPKEAGVEQSRTFLQQNQASDWSTVGIEGREFMVHPAVFNPGPFPSTRWFADFVKNYVKGQSDFCEVGCGAGVISCLVAFENPELKIVSTDINPFATETTKLNVEKLGLEKQISVTEGDVLDGVNKEHKFDTIFWALPFGFLDPGTKIDLRDMQLFDPGYRATRKFLTEAKNYLKPNGSILLGFSEDLGHADLLEDIGRDAGVLFEKVSEKEMQEKEVVTFQIIKGTYLSENK